MLLGWMFGFVLHRFIGGCVVGVSGRVSSGGGSGVEIAGDAFLAERVTTGKK